jgi:hypothetical protein
MFVTGTIPWDMFRTTLGGVTEERFVDAVFYRTTINIESSFELGVTPETLLEKNDELLQTQYHTRVVRTKIPFEIGFDLDLKLWAAVNVPSDHLRVAAALIDTSVLTVDPDSLPIATAQLEFVTVIPLPLILDSATIAVNDSDLSYGLNIQEIVSKRNCIESEAFCTQHWLVDVKPKKCTLDGQYVATMNAVCHPDSTNCLHPSPDYTDIVMDVTSDDYCGVTQEVDIYGSLSLQATQCNGLMQGTVTVSSPDGAAINSTEIVALLVSPTLVGPGNFLTVYDADNSIEILNYAATLTQPNQVDFSFEWRGAELRCDVVASVDAVVLVEFDATRPLLLEAGSTAKRSHGQNLLDDQSLRLGAKGLIGADRSTTGGNDRTLPVTPANSLSMSSPIAIALVSVLSALIVAVVAGGVVFYRRSVNKKNAAVVSEVEAPTPAEEA